MHSAYDASLAVIPASSAKTPGIDVAELPPRGFSASEPMDGAYTLPIVDPNYSQGTAPGEYRFTAPFTFAFEPRWGEVAPFVLRYSDPSGRKRHAEDFK